MISIIIPFYNEGKNIPILLDEISRVKEKIKDEIEVILVDDGSNEGLKFKVQSLKFKVQNFLKPIINYLIDLAKKENYSFTF